jgi:hypothetical protein
MLVDTGQPPHHRVNPYVAPPRQDASDTVGYDHIIMATLAQAVRTAVAWGLVIAIPPATAAPTAPEPRAPIAQSLEVVIPHAPVIVPVGGVRRLVYELHITNLGADSITLTRIDVLHGDRPDAAIGELHDAELQAALGRPGLAKLPADPRELGAGLRAVAYMWLPLHDGVAPAAVAHRIAADVAGSERITQGGRAPVSRAPVIALGPPLRGERWVAVYGPGIDRGHRRFLYTLDGHTRIPARFATDWKKLGEDDRFAPPGASEVTQWYGYGADVLAVADARVVDARDDVADDTAIGDRRPIALEHASGNYIVLDLGGRYAFYEHLKPHSLRVKPGARVRRGDVIAQLGNTGSSSTGPHLHFHVADAAAWLAGEGVPYVFDQLTLLGTFQSPDRAEATLPIAELPTGLAARRRRELPSPSAVVRF